MSWNISGLRDKLQESDILTFILNYDIVWLLETKYYFSLNVPGFIMHTNVSRSGMHRGGVVLLIKSRIAELVSSVDIEVEDQIWLELSCLPNVKLGGIYIPPDDSPYYHPSRYGEVAARSVDQQKVVMMGDFNSRVGVPSIANDKGDEYEYEGVCDYTVNGHGRTLLNICNNNELVIANHLKYDTRRLGGNLSYKQKTNWISEIDVCVVKANCIKLIKDLKVLQDVRGSDHAPLSVTLVVGNGTIITDNELKMRSRDLGKSYYWQPKYESAKNSLCYKKIDLENFSSELQEKVPPNLDDIVDMDAALYTGYETIIDTAVRSQIQRIEDLEIWDEDMPRWKRLLDKDDCKTIWKSINWKGKVSNMNEEHPSDEQFKEHFEELLNPSGNQRTDEPSDENMEELPYIPVLDDPFTINELELAVKDLNKNKSFCGLCPGLIKALPVSWLFFLLSFLNVVFSGICYPMLWCYSKLVVLFKSGDRMSCNNYRGISIMDTLAKMYDTMILNRLKLWYNIDKCQAGAQKHRGCVEQITAVRLLCDYAMYKKKKLYILFIDFSKAYDRVPRGKLIKYLMNLGCGKVMVKAIKAMYDCTKNILRSAVINSSVGVRQGAPTSCLLFILYIDRMVRMLKDSIESDGFLGNLHTLLLMDDAVILATSRLMCEKKMKVILKYCQEYGMVINEKKTKFFVINNEECDKRDLVVEGVTVKYCNKYLYLGAWLTDSGKVEDVLKLHEANNEAIVNKFSIFCVANSKMPFVYRKKVFDAAVTAAMLYSCESWLAKNLKRLERQYNTMIKCLLGVRKNTSTNLCMIEVRILPFNEIVEKRRLNFLKSKLSNIDLDEPFHAIYDLCKDANTPGYRLLKKTLDMQPVIDPFEKIANMITEKVYNTNVTKFSTYLSDLNPNMSVHPVYETKKYIPDYQRMSFTRLRLMSHNLRIEKGRWSRTPTELRVCQCDSTSIQTERHALLECPLTADLRVKFCILNFRSMSDLLGETENLAILCNFVYEVLRKFDQLPLH